MKLRNFFFLEEFSKITTSSSIEFADQKPITAFGSTKLSFLILSSIFLASFQRSLAALPTCLSSRIWGKFPCNSHA